MTTTPETPVLCFIHGMKSSHLSFAYIAKELGAEATINYDSRQPLVDSLLQVSAQLPKDRPLILIGHSLGGIISMLIAHAGTHDIRKVVTISSPIGGSRAALYARWITQELKVLNDITPYSPAITFLAFASAPCPVLCLVSTEGGVSVSQEPNDGIVTIASQKALPYGRKIEIPASHFEVLLHDKTVQSIDNFIKL